MVRADLQVCTPSHDHLRPACLTERHGAVREVCRIAARDSRVGEEREHRPVEVDHAGIAGQPDPTHRPVLIARIGFGSLRRDLTAVELLGEGAPRWSFQALERRRSLPPLWLCLDDTCCVAWSHTSVVTFCTLNTSRQLG